MVIFNCFSLMLCTAFVAVTSAATSNLSPVPNMSRARTGLNCSEVSPDVIRTGLESVCNASGQSKVLGCVCQTVLLNQSFKQLIGSLWNRTCPLVSKLIPPALGGGFNEAELKTLLSVLSDGFGGICPLTGSLGTCLSNIQEADYTQTDRDISAFVKINRLAGIVDSLCNLDRTATKLQCLVTKATVAPACFLDLITAISSNQAPENICGAFSVGMRCFRIVMESCDASYGQFVTYVEGSLPSYCSSAAQRLNGSPYGATLFQCGVAESATVVNEVMPLVNSQQNLDYSVLSQNILTKVCKDRLFTNLFNCLSKNLPTTNNTLDKFFGELIDFNQLRNSDVFAKAMCGEKMLKELPQIASCVPQKTVELGVCFQDPNAQVFSNAFGNFTNLPSSGTVIRNTFCPAISSLSSCFLNVVGKCNADAASFWRSVLGWAMRTDCNGSRNTPLAESLKAYLGDESGATQSVVSIVLMSLLMFLSMFWCM